MKSCLKALVWFAILFTAFGLACRKGTGEAEPNEPPTVMSTTAAETTNDSIAVTVNGFDITESDVQALVKPQIERIAKQMPPNVAEQYGKHLRQQVLEQMIVERLLAEKLEKEDVVVTEQEVTDKLTQVAAQQKPPLSLDELKAKIEAYGRDFEQIKQQVRQGIGYEKLFRARFGNQVDVNEEDAKRYYSENVQQFHTPEQVRASHILIKPDTTDPNLDPNQAKAQAKAKAEDLLKQIKEQGANFAELAKANSACPSSAKGGDLGFGNKSDPNSGTGGTWVAPFEQAAFQLQVGQVSDVVETRFGYHIIKVIDRKDPNTVTFEQAKSDIINKLTQDRQAELVGKYIELLKADANIVYPAGKEPNS